MTVRPDDLLTLIYTSGTTGPAKGVELTHANLLAEPAAVAEVLDTRFGDRITSYLPSAHIADRLSCHYLQILYGAEVMCVAGPRRIGEALPRLRPTIWVGAPRVWEKMKARIEQAVADAPAPRRALFALALKHSRRGTPVIAGLLDLLSLDSDSASAFTERHGDEALDPAIEEAVRLANSRLSRVEQIKRYKVLGGTWEPGGDELTPTLKWRRKAIMAKYAAEIESLYQYLCEQLKHVMVAVTF